jgi:hypothetical protein
MDDQGPSLRSRPPQFRLVALLTVVTFAAVYARFAVSFPTQAMTLICFACATAGMLCLVAAVTKIFDRASSRPRHQPQPPSPPPARLRWGGWVLAPLQEGTGSQADSWPRACFVALVTLVLTIALWKVIKGLSMTFVGLPTLHQLPVSRLEYLAFCWRDMIAWGDLDSWKWNLLWELCSQVHWWLHFAALGLYAIFVKYILGHKMRVQDWIRRYLLFAPWLMVLDLMLLFATWLLQPSVVPEPSTGFMVSIFRWELWHWDCWLDRFWLLRASFPCAFVSAVFLRKLFGTNWLISAAGGLATVPLAIMGCIASTLLFQNLTDWLGW